MRSINKSLGGALMAVGLLVLSGMSSSVMAQDFSYCYDGVPMRLDKAAGVSIGSVRVVLTDFGAKGDGVSDCTKAFADAVESLAGQGGGHLVVPAGLWMTGPIVLKSNIDLHLEKGAILLFSPDKNLYKKTPSVVCAPMISADGVENVSITGAGVIDGYGKYWRPAKRMKMSDTEWRRLDKLGGDKKTDKSIWFPYDLKHYANATKGPRSEELLRSDLVSIAGSNKVTIQGVTIQNAPRYHVCGLSSRNVVLDHVTINSPWNAQNAEGIELTSCQGVLVNGCTVDVGDAAVCLKAGQGAEGEKLGPTADVLVQDCHVGYSHGGIVFGGEFSGGIRNVVVRNCTMTGGEQGIRFRCAQGKGGLVKNVNISNIMMMDISDAAILVECNYVDRRYSTEISEQSQTASTKDAAKAYNPEFENVVIKNVVGRDVSIGLKATGIKGFKAFKSFKISNSTLFYVTEAQKVDTENTDIKMENVNFLTFKE